MALAILPARSKLSIDVGTLVQDQKIDRLGFEGLPYEGSVYNEVATTQ